MLKQGLIEFTYIALPKVLAGVLTLLFNIVLLRYLSLEEFGIYTLCISGILLADAIIGSAADMGVLRLSPLYRSSDYDRSINIERAAFSFKLLLSFLLFGVLVFNADNISQLIFESIEYTDVVYITSLAVITTLLYRSVLVHLQVDQKFPAYGKLDFTNIVVKYGGIASLIMFNIVTPGNILLFFVIGPGLASILGLLFNARKLFGPISGQLRVFGELFGYIKWYLLTFLVATVISRMDIFLLTGIGNLTDVGIFSGGYVYAMIPELFGIYLAVIFNPKIMPLYSSGKFFPFYKKVQSILWLTSVGSYLIVLLAIQFIAPILLPESYMASVDVMLGLFMGTLAGMAVFPMTISFIMFIKPRFILWLDIITLPILIWLYMRYIPEYGAVGAAWVSGVSRLVKSIIVQIAAISYARLKVPVTEDGMKWEAASDTDAANPHDMT